MTLEEQAAKAIYEARNGPGAVPWNHQPKGHRDPYLADARAAIAIITDEAAKVVEQTRGSYRTGRDGEAMPCALGRSARIAVTTAAQNVRALSEDRP